MLGGVAGGEKEGREMRPARLPKPKIHLVWPGFEEHQQLVRQSMGAACWAFLYRRAVGTAGRTHKPTISSCSFPKPPVSHFSILMDKWMEYVLEAVSSLLYLLPWSKHRSHACQRMLQPRRTSWPMYASLTTNSYTWGVGHGAKVCGNQFNFRQA